MHSRSVAFIKKITLRLTPITHGGLIAAGFDVSGLFYRFGDLNIYFSNNRFFYHTPRNKRKIIRNMLQVSNLIYGKTEYLHV